MPHEAQESNASVAWQVQNLLRKSGQHQHDFLQMKLEVVDGLGIGVLSEIVMILEPDPPPKETNEFPTRSLNKSLTIDSAS